MGKGSPSMSTMTSTSDSLTSSIPEADRKKEICLIVIVAAFIICFTSRHIATFG